MKVHYAQYTNAAQSINQASKQSINQIKSNEQNTPVCHKQIKILLTFASHNLRGIKRRPSKYIICCLAVQTLSPRTRQLIPWEYKRNNAAQKVQCGASLPWRSFIDCNLQIQFVYPYIIVWQQLHQLIPIHISAAATNTRLHTQCKMMDQLVHVLITTIT